MELGHYGWNRKVDIFQQHTVFLDRPAPATTNYGVLNIGDGPFDGVSPNKFSGATLGTALAINTGTTFSGLSVDVQSGGARLFSINAGSGNVNLSNYATFFVFADAPITTQQGLCNLGSQYYSGAGQFAGSANGTYLAINSTSGFTGRYFDCQKAGATLLYLDSNGNLLLPAGYIDISHDPDPSNLYGLVNIGTAFFTGAGQFSGSSNGTGIAVNFPSGFTGSLADWQINGVSKFSVSATGAVTTTTVTATKLTGLAAVEAALQFT
jgi:hypothetical protein